MRRTSLLLLLLTLLHSLATAATDTLVTRLLSSTHGDLPCDETAVTLQDRDGFIWIGTRLGLYRYDGYALQSYRNDIDHPHRFTSCDIKQLAEDRDGVLWIGTFRGVNRLDKRTGEVLRFNDGDSVPSGYTWQLVCDRDGIVRARSDRGWYAYTDGRWQRTSEPTVPLAPNGSAVQRDRDGATWRCLPFGGVELSMPRRSPFANDRLRDTTDAIRALTVDASGTLWVGTQRGDVLRRDAATGDLVATRFRTMAGEDIRQPLQVNALCALPDGRLMVGTERHGLYACAADGTVLMHYDRATPWLCDNCIYSLLATPDGRLLIGTWAGLSVMEPGGSGSYIAAAGTTDLRHTHVLSITQTAADDYWLGLIGGVLHLQGPLTTPSHARAFLYTYVGQSATTPASVGQSADTDEPANPNYRIGGIYRILRDGHGDLWACTSEPGLLRYDADSDAFCSVSRQFGISGDNVRSMEEDADGRLWMLTNCGLACLDTPQPDGERPLHLYTVRHGLPRNYYGNSTSLSLADGRLCVAAGSDLTVLTPAEAAQRVGPAPHRCLVTDITVQGISLWDMESRAWQRVADVLPPYTRHVTLPPGRGTLGISFSSFNFVEPEAVQFAYRLEGMENEWVYPQAGVSTVRYVNLSPGTYTFRVRTTDGAEEAQLRITVLPPLWRRWWAWCLYALAVLAAVAYVRRRWQLRRERLEMQRLMALERERNEELSAIVAQLGRQQGQPAPTGVEVAEAISSYDADFLRRCDEAIRQNLSNPEFDQQALIAAVGTSHSTLYRKLKTLCGTDATTYIRRFRLQTACEMMRRQPGIRVAELADAVGFSSPKYFATCFRKEMGCTPTEWVAKGGLHALCLLFCLSGLMSLHAQPALHIGTAEGMPAEHVVCLAEDGRGMLWMGTEEGLVGYDGVGFEHYTTENSGLTGNGFSALWADTLTGRLWLGLKSGLAVMDLQTRRIHPYEIPGFYNIADLAPAADGGLWVLNIEDRFAHLSADPDGKTTERTAVVYEMADFQGLYNRPTMLRDLGGGRLSVESPVGCWLVDVQTRAVESRPQPEGWDDLAHRLLLTDHNGNRWRGSAGGLECWPHRQSEFQLLQAEDGGQDFMASSVLSMPDTTFWVGTSGKLFHYDQAGKLLQCCPIRTPQGIALYPYVLRQESEETLLLGTEAEGLWRFNRLTGRLQQIPSPSSVLSVYALHRQSHRWLLATSDGVYELRDGENGLERLTDMNRALPSHYVFSLAEDAQKKLWVGIYGSGIQIFDAQGRHLQSLNPRDTIPGLPSFPSGAITHLHCDSHGRMWAATLEGVIRFDDTREPTRYTLYSLGHGLPTLYIRAIGEDGDGRLWVTTNRGLVRFDEARDVFCTYHRPSGLPGRPFCNGALALLADGQMAIGSEGGATLFDPQEAAEPKPLPRLQLMSFMLLRTDPHGAMASQFIPQDSLTFGYRDNTFTLTFSLADAALAEMVEYAYRVDGAGGQWISLGQSPKLTLHSLVPGNYSVEMRVRLMGQPWPEEAACTVAFRVRPPWWLSWWAYVLYAMLALGVIVQVMRAYRRRLALENNLRYVISLNKDLSAQLAERENAAMQPAQAQDTREQEMPVSTISKADQALLDKLSRIIFDNLDNPELDIDLLCDRMAMSRSTLYRKVKNMLGMSTNEYIRMVRLDEAARRIAHGDLTEQTIAAIAGDCGFNSLSYFRTCFKERFGVTPSEYGK
ncbi:MAG: helix-turn-helix domain-containing protein [Bacteroidaceae bacterium]|nr:helix-turn-helix domain-containing protein [Bacteroidaceae bacterium]MBR1683463.1 helix-turn-helix domain-containing protein [Bacteroidaceae bacterium]